MTMEFLPKHHCTLLMVLCWKSPMKRMEPSNPQPSRKAPSSLMYSNVIHYYARNNYTLPKLGSYYLFFNTIFLIESVCLFHFSHHSFNLILVNTIFHLILALHPFTVITFITDNFISFTKQTIKHRLSSICFRSITMFDI